MNYKENIKGVIMNMKNNDKNVDSSSQPLSKEIKHDFPMIQDSNNVTDIIIPRPLTPEELEKYDDIAEELEGNDSTAVPTLHGEMKIKNEDNTKGKTMKFKVKVEIVGGGISPRTYDIDGTFNEIANKVREIYLKEVKENDLDLKCNISFTHCKVT